MPEKHVAFSFFFAPKYYAMLALVCVLLVPVSAM